jgi:hypothetical protein
MTARGPIVPNWCSNKLEIDGPAGCVDHFMALFAKSGFAGHRPEPGNADCDPQYDWYQWRKHNWGCKWNVTDEDWSLRTEEVTGDLRTVCLSLTTAWSPPIEWLRVAAAYYIDRPVHFRLTFLQEGNDFSGVIEFACEAKIERVTTGSVASDDPFQTAAHRSALIEFDSDAAITYTFVAEIAGARLPITPTMSAKYPPIAQAKAALDLGDRDRALGLIRRAIRCTFDVAGVEDAVPFLSRSFDDGGEDDESRVDVEEITFESDALVISATCHFSIAFAVPFVSRRDFYDTCEGNGVLSKGVRLWFDDLEFENFQLITVEPAAHNWGNTGLASLGGLFEDSKPSTGT